MDQCRGNCLNQNGLYDFETPGCCVPVRCPYYMGCRMIGPQFVLDNFGGYCLDCTTARNRFGIAAMDRLHQKCSAQNACFTCCRDKSHAPQGCWCNRDPGHCLKCYRVMLQQEITKMSVKETIDQINASSSPWSTFGTK